MRKEHPTRRHRIEYALLMGIARVSSLLGKRGARVFGTAIGALGYFPLRFRRRLVESHLRLAFPDKDDRWIRRLARASYAHFGREGLEAVRFASMSPEELLRITHVKGLDVLEAAIAQGKGIVLMTGHIGNIEVFGPALAQRGIPVDLVVARQSNPLVDDAIIAARRRMNLGIIDRAQAPRLVMRSLRAGRVVAFAPDQDASRSGVFVPFFGRLASTHRGPALFAVRSGAPALMTTVLRKGDGYQITLEPLEVDRSGEVDDVVYRLTAAFTARLEQVVRAAPDQYLWLHKRWKTRPPESLQSGT